MLKCWTIRQHSNYQFRSVAQSCLTLCDPMDCNMPGFPVLHQLPEFTQTHVHWVGDAVQLSHPLLSASPLAFNPSQHQSLFQWVSSSHQGGQSIRPSASASVLPMNIQGWFPLELTGLISLQSKGLSESSLLCNQFSSVQSLTHVWLFATPYTAVHQASLSFTNSRNLLKLMSIESVMPSNHLIICHPLLLLP